MKTDAKMQRPEYVRDYILKLLDNAKERGVNINVNSVEIVQSVYPFSANQARIILAYW